MRQGRKKKKKKKQVLKREAEFPSCAINTFLALYAHLPVRKIWAMNGGEGIVVVSNTGRADTGVYR